jgi:hypothetical protein
MRWKENSKTAPFAKMRKASGTPPYFGGMILVIRGVELSEPPANSPVSSLAMAIC